jgi:4-amino-4-deoxy-L-arabinose transferase-like glycosyltransferase
MPIGKDRIAERPSCGAAAARSYDAAAVTRSGGLVKTTIEPRFWLRLVAVALAVRVIVVFGLLHDMPVVSDAAEYAAQARDLVHHVPTGAYYWPPGQSYFLAAVFAVVGDSGMAAKAANITVDVVAVVLATLLGGRLLTDSRAVRITGWMLALFPSTILMSGQPYSLSLTMVCLLGATLLLLGSNESSRWPYFTLAGALSGFAVLTRPSTLSAIIGLAVVAAIVARRLSKTGDRVRLRALGLGSVAFIAAAAAVVAPAVYHNAVHDAGWTVSTANEQNFWLGNNPYTPTYKTWELGSQPATDFSPEVQRYLARFGDGPPTLAERHAMLEEAGRFVVHHPAITALRTFNRAQAFWGFDYTPSNDVKEAYGLTRLRELPLTAIEAGGWIIVGLLALVGITAARHLIRLGVALFILAIVVAYALAYIVAYSAGHWHEPILGFVVPFAGAGAAWVTATPNALGKLVRNRAFLLLALLFVIVQFVYAYAVATSL